MLLNGITHRTTRTTLKACCATLATLVLATAAQASPGDRHVVVSGNVYVNGGRTVFPTPAYPSRQRVVVHGENCGCDACMIKREYARGASRGESAGANQGYRDGISGKPFCADIRDDLCDNSRPYRDGYAATFGRSYQCAYEQGRVERMRACKPQPQCHQPPRVVYPYRPRCP